MMDSLYSLIKQTKEHDENAALEILNNFEPLLRKYSYKLYYEDAHNDLTLALLEIIYHIPIDNFPSGTMNDKYIVSYICKSMYNKYVNLSIQYHNLDKFYLSDNEELMEFLGGTDYDEMDLSMAVKIGLEQLSPLQKVIVKESFFNDKSDADIGRMFGITRQAVGKTKRKALSILHSYFER